MLIFIYGSLRGQLFTQFKEFEEIIYFPLPENRLCVISSFKMSFSTHV